MPTAVAVRALDMDTLTTLATFGATWAALAVGHNLADHVFGQSDHQAANKGAPTAEEIAAGASPRRGWTACLAHVAQYHLVVAGLLGLLWLALPLPLSATGLTVGLAWSAATHAVLDRRWPVRWNPGELHQMRDRLMLAAVVLREV